MLKYLSVLALIFYCASVSAQDMYLQQHNNSATATLYYHPNCSHCKTVMKYLSQQNKTVQMKNTSNPSYKTELNSMGQRGVPVLVVNGRSIAGSTSIINYLKQNPEVLR